MCVNLCLKGIQPRRKFYTQSQALCQTGLGKVSGLSSGLDPQNQGIQPRRKFCTQIQALRLTGLATYY